MKGAQLHAALVAQSEILPNGRPYGCVEFGGDLHENALCRLTRDLVLRLLSDLPVPRILEIGSGGGRWTRFLATLTNDLVCVDATDTTVDHIAALKLPTPLTFLICKDGRLPSQTGQLLNQSVDLIFSYDTFVHFPENLFLTYLDRLADTLKPHGHMVLHHGSQMNRMPHQPIDQTGNWFYYEDSAVDMRMATAGFRKLEELHATEGFGSRVVCYTRQD